MTETLDLSLFAKPMADGTLGMDLAVEGIACGGCIGRIEHAVRSAAGRDRGAAQFHQPPAARRLARKAASSRPQILRALEDAAIAAIRSCRCAPSSEEAAEARRLTRCLAVAGFAAMNIMLLSVSVWSGNVTDMTPGDARLLPLGLGADRAAGGGLCRAGRSFASAWRALRVALAQHGRADLARRDPGARHVGGRNRQSRRARLFRFRHHAAVFPAGRAGARPRDAPQDRAVAGNLAALKAENAHRFIGDELVSVPAAALKAGDRLLVRPGERVPADGIVLGGTSEIDESLITGETARRKVASGATVYAGSMNYSGALTLQVTAAGGAAADRRDRAAAGEGGEREIARHAAGRPRLALLCAASCISPPR